MSLAVAKELREKRANLWNQANEIIERAAAEGRERTAEENEQIDRIHDEMDRLQREIERLERHHDLSRQLSESAGVIVGLQDGAQAAGYSGRDIDSVVDEEIRQWLLNEDERQPKRFLLRNAFAPERELRRMLPELREQRALGTGSGPAGGYTVPQGFYRVLEDAMLAYGGMRQARTTILRTASGEPLPMPTANDTDNEGIIISENPSTKVPEQDITFGQETLRAHMYSSKAIRVSFQLLQDSAFDLATYIAAKLGERIGRVTNRHFTVGSGTGEPKGVVTAAVVGKTAASASGITDLELVDLIHSVDPAYRAQAEFMFHDDTLRLLKNLRDQEGRPLWLPGLAVREPDTILGHRYVVNNHMPQIGAGNKSVLFGDFSKYYIRDVMDVLLIRLDEVYAEYGQVAFLAFSRHDGTLLDAGTHPIKALQHPAS